MHRAIAALAIAVVSAAVPVGAQETEITVGGGVGLEPFDEDVLTYPTADLGLTRWWANGWGLGGRGTFQVGTALHPYSHGIYSPIFNQPPGTRFIGVSGRLERRCSCAAAGFIVAPSSMLGSGGPSSRTRTARCCPTGASAKSGTAVAVPSTGVSWRTKY